MTSPFNSAAGRRRRRRWIKRLLLLAAFSVAAVAGASFGLYLFEKTEIPDVRQLEEYKPSIITRIHSDSGAIIGEFAQERRILVDYQELPENLRHAIVAVEDADYYKHHGINIEGILRAAWRNFQAGRVIEG